MIQVYVTLNTGTLVNWGHSNTRPEETGIIIRNETLDEKDYNYICRVKRNLS